MPHLNLRWLTYTIIGGLFCLSSLQAIPIVAQMPISPAIATAVSSNNNSNNVRSLSHIGGPVNAIAVVGDKAYMAEGVTLTILDVSQPTQPRVLARSHSLDANLLGVAVQGTFAYVVASSGFYVFDVSDATTILEVGFYAMPAAAQGVFVVGNTAYVADRNSGLRIVNVSNPQVPSEVGFYDTPGSAQDAYVAGDIAYVADGNSGLRLVNVINPMAPREVGFYDTPGSAQGVYVVDNIAYVADDNGGLRIVDVSNVTAPREVGFSDSLQYAVGVYVVDHMAYVTDRSEGLRLLNVSNAAAPTEVNFYDTPGEAVAVFLVGSNAYVADWDRGLRILDVGNETTLNELGFYDPMGFTKRVFIVENTAYVAEVYGLRVVNVANSAIPQAVGFFALPYCEGIFVVQTTAYMACDDGLTVVDVTNPATPNKIGFYPMASGANGVFVTNELAYVVTRLGDGLVVVNVSNPASPSKVGVLSVGGANNVFVVDNTAYVVGWEGLQVVDVSNPAAPQGIGFFATVGIANDVYVIRNTAYVAAARALHLVNVTNRAAPSQIGLYNRGALGIYVVGSTVYVTNGGGLQIVDVTDPVAPNEVGFYETPGFAFSVFVQANIIYVADASGGLSLLRYPACYRLNLTFTGHGAVPATTPSNSPGCLTREYLPGTQVTLTASPANTWRVASWTGTNNDATTSVNNLLTMPAADHAVAVNYAPVCYNLALTHTGTGDDPKPSPANSDGCATKQYVAGQAITLQASPGPGATVGGWLGTANDSSTAGENRFIMPATSHTVGVNYIPACYRLTLLHTGAGSDPSATPPQSAACVTGYYHYNEAITLSASPATGWQISAWSGTVNNAATTLVNTVMMPPADHTLTVHYGELPVSGEGDTYETDGSCTRSRPIITDGSEAQSHTFHTADDHDWIRFDAAAGTRYRVEVVVPEGSIADVAMESYRNCESAPSEQSSPKFSAGARLDISRTVSGPTYIRLVPVRSEQTGAKAIYQVSVRNLSAPPPNRALIIVAGRLKMNDLVQPNIDHVADRVYKLFQSKGYTDDNIFLLTTDAGQALRDAPATKANLKAAITEWAPPHIANGVLTLYMIDHGAEEKFYLDNVNHEEVTPTELDEWLDTVEGQVAGVKINVVIEACQSGSFISSSGGSIGGNGRVVVTSSNQTEDAYASAEGAYFSDHLLSWLQQDYSIRKSFEEANAAATAIHQRQGPWLDANGDGIGNKEEDYRIAGQRGFAFPGTLPGDEWAPEFFAVEQLGSVNDGTVHLRVDVRDDKSVRQVWVVIYPPDYTPPAAGAELRPEVLPMVLFTRVDNDNHWEAKVAGLQQQGSYRLIIHAEDGVGMVARPAMLTVNTAQADRIYLPLIRR